MFVSYFQIIKFKLCQIGLYFTNLHSNLFQGIKINAVATVVTIMIEENIFLNYFTINLNYSKECLIENFNINFFNSFSILMQFILF